MIHLRTTTRSLEQICSNQRVLIFMNVCQKAHFIVYPHSKSSYWFVFLLRYRRLGDKTISTSLARSCLARTLKLVGYTRQTNNECLLPITQLSELAKYNTKCCTQPKCRLVLWNAMLILADLLAWCVDTTGKQAEAPGMCTNQNRRL